MAGFLYFLPNVSRSNLDAVVKQRGLGYAFDGGRASRECQSGPGGMPGLILADAQRLGDLEAGYYPDRQTWRQIPGVDAWVGYFTARKPIAADLARPKQLQGHFVELLDGGHWLVPMARSYIEEESELRYLCMLPERATLNAQGQWAPGPVIDRFAPLWAIGERWVDKGMAGTKYGDGVRDSVAAMQVNYVLGEVEADVLGLFTADHIKEVLDAVIDTPTLRAWQKKRIDGAPDGSSSADGPEAVTDDTGPHSQT